MTTISNLQSALGLSMFFGVLHAAPAVAQDEPKPDDAPAEEAEGEAEEAAEAPAEAPPAEAATDAPAASPSEKPVLEETVYVVQSKPFISVGHFELTPQIAQSINDQFTSHTGLMLSGLYHVKENVALELTIGGFFWWDNPGTDAPRLGGRDTDLTVELRQKENLAPERVKLYQFPYLVAADLQWSPLYGKVNVQDIVLGQFSLYLSVGAGVMGLQLETLTPGVNKKNFVELKGIGGVLPPLALTTTFGGGLRFYFTEWLGVRLEVRDYVTPLSVFQSGENAVSDANAPSFDVTNTILTQMGVTFVF